MAQTRQEQFRHAAEDLLPTAEMVGRIVVILLGGVMAGYLILDLAHTMALWHSPLSP
jgi:hypothetical protein